MCSSDLSESSESLSEEEPNKFWRMVSESRLSLSAMYVYQVAQFTLSAVWGVRSCISTYKYSVKLQRCNSPRGLYLEARYNGFFALEARKIHYNTYSYFGVLGWTSL